MLKSDLGLRLSISILMALMTATALPAADRDTSQNLFFIKFFIKRSKTAKEVHYIDILGYSEDRQPVFERIPKTGRGRAFLSSPPDDTRWKSGAQTRGRHG